MPMTKLPFAAAALAACCTVWAEPKDAKETKPKKGTPVILGIKTPGVAIPFASLKSDAEIALDSPPAGLVFTESLVVANATGVKRFDPKTNKPYDPPRDLKGLEKACGGLVSAFGFLWGPSCGDSTLAKIELRPVRGAGPGGRGAGAPPSAKPVTGAGGSAEKPAAEASPGGPAKKEDAPQEGEKTAGPPPERLRPATPEKPIPPVAIALGNSPVADAAIAASDDSVWVLSDAKSILQRIDPKENTTVAEIRLPANCKQILFAEASLWVACAGENRILRINPQTNLVAKRVEVTAEPVALAFGEGSIWALSKKEGKIARIDPKTDKVTATIDLAVPNVGGSLAFGEGSLWVSMPGYPIARIVPANDKVVQQFHGEGGGKIQFGLGSLWIGSADSKTLVRLDPKRVVATLAE